MILSPGCAAVVTWVCGTNGKSYQNSCKASIAGVAVRHKGKCRRRVRRVQCRKKGKVGCRRAARCRWNANRNVCLLRRNDIEDYGFDVFGEE